MNITKISHHAIYPHTVSNFLFYVIAALLMIAYLAFQPEMLSLGQAQSISAGYDSQAVAYVISFAIMLLCALTPIPAELIALANTFMYSPMEAFMVTWFSALLSAQAGYELGRLNWFDPCKYSQGSKICRWLNAYGYKALALLRLIPVVPFFVLNIGGGLFKLDRCKYALITAITIAPAVAVLTFFPSLFV